MFQKRNVGPQLGTLFFRKNSLHQKSLYKIIATRPSLATFYLVSHAACLANINRFPGLLEIPFHVKNVNGLRVSSLSIERS